MAKKKKSESTEIVKEDIYDLVCSVNAENPDPAAIEKVKEFFDKDDSYPRANQAAEKTFVEYAHAVAPSSALVRDFIAREVKAHRKELGYFEASFPVRVMIDSLIISHLRYQHFVNSHARWLAKGDFTIQQGLYWDKLLSGHQKRLTRAVEGLARLRLTMAETELALQRADAKRRRTADMQIAAMD